MTSEQAWRVALESRDILPCCEIGLTRLLANERHLIWYDVVSGSKALPLPCLEGWEAGGLSDFIAR
jgi:hypothetical protein